MCVALAGLGAAAGAAGAGGAAAAGGTGLASTAMGYLMNYGPMALSIGSSLMDSNSATSEAEQKYNQLKWEIEARNIEKKGQALRNQDLYKQTAWRELDTATRAYLKTDIELDQEVSKANLATQTNLVNLIEGSGKGAAKGLGGSTGARIDMQAIKNWGRKDAAIRHGIREKALAAEFNKESAQSRAGDAIKIARGKLGVDIPTIYEGYPQRPEKDNPIPKIAMNVGKGLFDLWSSNSGPSPFNLPGSDAISGAAGIFGGMNSGLSSFGNYKGLSANPFSGPISGAAGIFR